MELFMCERMNVLFRRISLLLLSLAGTVSATAPFFDPSVPLHGSAVNAGKSGIIARGLLIRLAEGEWLIYDQDLLRPALWFSSPAGKPPLTMSMMSQASWDEPTKRGGLYSSRPSAEGVDLAPPLPGVAGTLEEILKDPRPVYGTDPGRGGLEKTGRRFLGHGFAGDLAILSYECGEVKVREWFEKSSTGFVRNFSVGPGPERLFLLGDGEFSIEEKRRASSTNLHVMSNHAGMTLESSGGKLVGRLASSTGERRVSLSYGRELIAPPVRTAEVPSANPARWNRPVEISIRMADKTGPGWAIDRLPLPVDNPWKRRIRPADIVFLSVDTAAVVTFEGDVWRVDFKGSRASWRRIAAGLSEPLSIAQVSGVIQVFTRNGIIRLRDLNQDGETDYYENHSSLIHQTIGTRGYPLDMEVDEDGRSWVSIGGIVTDSRSITNKAPANPHSGAILEISPDGRKLETFASHAREPFFGRDPVSGRIVMSEQQGNWIPSSGIFPVPNGANFGYGGGEKSVSLPAVWIPHDQDNSSSSPLWMRGTGFSAWDGGVMQLSYGTGRLFLARPGGGWPSVEGAVIPLGIETGVPILHATAHPNDGSIWLAGFRIYDSRVPALEGIARLRATKETVTEPVDARVVKEGIVLKFAGELAEASPAMVQAKEWQYRRSGGYGSPRLKRDGGQGVEPVATGGVFLSKDKTSVFIHIPGLKPTMQLELSHRFHLKRAQGGMRPVFFTVTAPPPADWKELGFDPPVLDASLAEIHDAPADDSAPTAARGKEIATRFGCLACHSVDGAKEGHSGPSWKGLHGSERRFTDGTKRVADDAYLLEAIIEPAKTIVEGYSLGMGSYAGVLSEPELKSILLYIRELK